MMPCPYCRSRKVREERTVRTYDLPDEWVAINNVQCGKCGCTYSKTIRDNLRTGRRRVVVSKGSGYAPVPSRNAKRSIRQRIRDLRLRRRW